MAGCVFFFFTTPHPLTKVQSQIVNFECKSFASPNYMFIPTIKGRTVQQQSAERQKRIYFLRTGECTKIQSLIPMISQKRNKK